MMDHPRASFQCFWQKMTSRVNDNYWQVTEARCVSHDSLAWVRNPGSFMWASASGFLFIKHSRAAKPHSRLLLSGGESKAVSSILYLTPKDHRNNDFSYTIQSQWKFYYALIKVVTERSLQILAYATTTVLSWHVQNIVVIWWLLTEL